MAGNFTGAQGFLANPMIAMLPPDQQQNLLQLQQRQAIGQALLAQGMQPADYGGANVGGIAYHVSPLNGAAKLLSAYLGNKMTMDSLGQQANLMGQMYGNAFGATPNSSAAAASAPTSGESVSMPPPAAADVAPMQGVSAGMGLTQPTPMQLGQAMGAQPAPGGAAAAPRPGGPLTLPGKTPQESMMLYSMLGPEGYARVAAAWGAPTDASRMAYAAGIDPAQANADALFKANYIAPNQGTPGTIARDPRTNRPIYYSPSVPDGAQPVFDAAGNLAGVAPLRGASDAIASAAQARTAGEGAALPYAGFDAAGNPLPVTNRTAAAMGGGPPAAGAAPNLSQIFLQQESNGGKTAPDNPFQIQKPTFDRFAQPGESWNNVADRNVVAQRILAKFNQDYGGDVGRIATAYFSGEGNVAPAGSPTPYLKNVSDSNGKSVASYVSDIARRAGVSAPASGGAIYAAQPLGVVAGATAASTNQQGELSKKWSDLTAQNQQAQSVISNLQNIKTLAGKAIVGPQSDRLAYANSLLSLAGSERATDMTTANDLLNKYSNQITARLGQGGMGTDAARAILQSAYPNSHMTQGAINEAADNLIGAQQMVQAKARVLAPLRNSNDAAGYTNAELAFDQNADPRIFQYTGIKDPTARAAFAKNLIAQDPGIVDKIQALQKLGALK
ncbi:hypothetical protein NTJ56_08815 [Burkholderia contaminans]|uniref:hypothetical protein n=1 Tax=Burkholderia contaminans TaxID=488447 RepID=UPI00214FA2E4|nr:hypothetical protein [Burkholderia contaminans]UUX38888.1 hypothetical protein NTJ56_08815 [Burkholderia contaminans]